MLPSLLVLMRQFIAEARLVRLDNFGACRFSLALNEWCRSFPEAPPTLPSDSAHELRNCRPLRWKQVLLHRGSSFAFYHLTAPVGVVETVGLHIDSDVVPDEGTAERAKR